MRQRNDVFFFTFIDLLLQVIFVGLLLFAAPLRHQWKEYRELKATRAVCQELMKAVKDPAQIADLLRRSGVSNIVELSDKLTRMVPADQCIPPKQWKADHEFLVAYGGKESVQKKLAQLEEAYGPPPCERELDATGRPVLDRSGGLIPVSIATLRVTDDGVEFEEGQPSAALSNVLNDLGLEYTQVRKLSLESFRRHFGGRRLEGPGRCRHFVMIRALTDLRAPVDAVRSAFPQKGRILAR
jgi:hypothetical protein